MAKLSDKCAEITDLYTQTADAWSEARANSVKCFEYVMNEQWTASQKAEFERTKRIPLQYNMILPRLHNLFGTEQLNRTSTRIRPKDKTQTKLADILNGIYLNEWEANEGEAELQKVFADGLIMPVPGWLEIGIWYDELGYGHYSFKSANPLNILPDPDFTDYKLRDCQYIIKEKWLTLPQIIDIYGNRTEYDDAYAKVDKNLWDKVGNQLRSFFGAGDLARQYTNEDGNKFKIIERQTREYVIKKLIYDSQTGDYQLLPKKEAETLLKEGRYIYLKDQKVNNIHLTTINPFFNITLLDEPSKIECDMYDVIPYISMDFNNVKSKNSSMVYTLLDIQTNLNKREIQKTNWIDLSNSGIMIADAVDKEVAEDFQERGNQPNFVWLSRNFRNPPHRIPPPQIPPDVWNDIQDSVSKMNDISGINDAARGESQYSNESARLFAMKTERVAATINPYFNNLTKTRKMCAEYFLKTVKQVYGDTNRQVDIMDKKKDTQTDIINLDLGNGEIFNDIQQFEGNVVIDESTYNVTKQQADFQTKLVIYQILGSRPELVNWEWMLSDSELPDIQKQIDHLNNVLQQNADVQAQQQALANEQAMLEQLNLEKQYSTPQATEKGNNNGKK